MAWQTLVPKSVDFRPVSACNMRCPFCFGPRRHLPSLPIDQALAIVDFIAANGAEAVVLSGGEPLLYAELPTLCAYIKAKNLRLVLSTNATLLLKRGPELLEYIDWVGIPLDAADAAVNAQMRVWSRDHFSASIEALDYLRTSWKGVKIKLGTVVSRINADSVAKIPETLGERRCPDTWKVYQFSETSYGADNADVLRLTDDEFKACLGPIQSSADRWGAPLVVYTNQGRNGAYLFINSDASLSITSGGDEIRVANLRQDGLEGAFRIARQYVNGERNLANERQTYPMAATIALEDTTRPLPTLIAEQLPRPSLPLYPPVPRNAVVRSRC